MKTFTLRLDGTWLLNDRFHECEFAAAPTYSDGSCRVCAPCGVVRFESASLARYAAGFADRPHGIEVVELATTIRGDLVIMGVC